MSESKHTPGPWVYRSHQIIGRNVDGSLQVIALIGSDDERSDLLNLFAQELLEANARLIAAAPDLLAACEAFVKQVDQGHSRSFGCYGLMKSVIAKAKGTP